jgi:hypothetical protein
VLTGTDLTTRALQPVGEGGLGDPNPHVSEAGVREEFLAAKLYQRDVFVVTAGTTVQDHLFCSGVF